MNAVVPGDYDLVSSLVLFTLELANNSVDHKEVLILQLGSLGQCDLTFLLAREYPKVPHLIESTVVESTEQNNLTLINLERT
jgi:hypothetical protein